MSRIPMTSSAADDADEAWLRDALHDDLARAPYLADDGFSVRVVQKLPAPRLPWLDGISALLVLAVLAIGLWPLAGAFGETFAAVAQATMAQLSGQAAPLLGRLSLNVVLTAFAPLLALAATAVLLAEI
jgi:hypothetical protein